jgi:hypothetical protein
MTDLYKAMLAAQKAMPNVKEGSVNPAFRSKYADLEDVLGTIGPVLHANGILYVQGGTNHDGRPWLVTQLIHAETGQTIAFELPIVGKDPDNPQAMGAAITYAKRYGLLAILGVATEDDDGNSAARSPRPNAPIVNPTPPGRDQGANTTHNPFGPVDTSTGEIQRPQARAGVPISPDQIRLVWAMAGDKGVDEVRIHEYIKKAFDKDSVKDLDRREASLLIDKIKTFDAVPLMAGTTGAAGNDRFTQ